MSKLSHYLLSARDICSVKVHVRMIEKSNNEIGYEGRGRIKKKTIAWLYCTSNKQNSSALLFLVCIQRGYSLVPLPYHWSLHVNAVPVFIALSSFADDRVNWSIEQTTTLWLFY